MKSLLSCCLLTCSIYAYRTVHRLNKKILPRIVVWSDKHPQKHTLIDTNLRPVPLLKTFDKKHFEENLLPNDTISYRYEKKTIRRQTLNNLIANLMSEIEEKKLTYKNFIILKNSGFVRHKKCGLLIAKFKDHPFILKLFIEPPQSFINPYDKGFEVANVFVASGSLRHTLGFSRIKTLNYLHKKIKNDPRWGNRIVTPRKWFWLPKESDWLNIKTYNLGKKKKDFVRIPSTYAVIADAMESTPETPLDNDELMAFSKFLEHRLDPHTKNFFIDKYTKKIAVIDTELFPLILGFNELIQSHDGHIEWYVHLAGKYSKEKFLSSKRDRIRRQYDTYNYYLD